MKDFFSKFTEKIFKYIYCKEILNGKPYFLCSVRTTLSLLHFVDVTDVFQVYEINALMLPI